jgi:hypothetical protein
MPRPESYEWCPPPARCGGVTGVVIILLTAVIIGLGWFMA